MTSLRYLRNLPAMIVPSAFSVAPDQPYLSGMEAVNAAG